MNSKYLSSFLLPLAMASSVYAAQIGPRGREGDGEGPGQNLPPSQPSPTPTATSGEPENFQECSVSQDGVLRLSVSDKQFKHYDTWAGLDDRRLFWAGETAFGSENGDLVLATDGVDDRQGFRVLRYDHAPQWRLDLPGTPVLPRRPEYFYLISPGKGKTTTTEPMPQAIYAFDLDGNETGRLLGRFSAAAASSNGELLLAREESGAYFLLTYKGRVLWRKHLGENAGGWNRENSVNVAVLDNGNVVAAGGAGDGTSGHAELIDGSGQILRNSAFEIPIQVVSENGRYMAGRRGQTEIEVYDFLSGSVLRYEYRVQPITPGYDIHSFEINDFGWLAVVDSGGRLLIYNSAGNLASQPELGFPPGRISSHWGGKFLECLGGHGLATVEWFTGRVVDRRPAEGF